jgi:hypothetical protein
MIKKNTFTALLISTAVSAIIMSFNLPEGRGGFKNLKVLPKDISKKELDSTMDYYAISLGVRCGFCHARLADTTKRGLDFANDSKPEKLRAREMIRLTGNLNVTYFNTLNSTKPDTLKTVTCFTCHRGGKSPDAANLREQYNKLIPEKKKK